MVDIAATGGCGYVSVSWTVTAIDDVVCNINHFTVKLSSMNLFKPKIATGVVKSDHNFTGLHNDTIFTVTVTAKTLIGTIASQNFTTVTIESTCLNCVLCTHAQIMFNHTYMQYVRMYIRTY